MGEECDDFESTKFYQERAISVACDEYRVKLSGVWDGDNIEVRGADLTVQYTGTDPTSSPENVFVASFNTIGEYQWNYYFDQATDVFNGLDIAVDCDGLYLLNTASSAVTSPGGDLITSNHDNGLIIGIDKNTGIENYTLIFTEYFLDILFNIFFFYILMGYTLL